MRIDAALLDLKMPGMDGLTLLKEVRKNYPAIMVIMLTGQGGVKEAVEAIKLGAVDFLEKPLSPEGLRALQNALAKSGGNRKEAAEILGIGEATLYREMRKYQSSGIRIISRYTPILSCPAASIKMIDATCSLLSI
jgi:DNA-binding NtrC family response regulator